MGPRRLLAALAAGIALLGAAPAAPAGAAVTHAIEIDASALYGDLFVIVGGGWLDATHVQTVELVERQPYRIRAGATGASFAFWADEAGHVQYDAGDGQTFVTGAGTNRMTLAGLPVTVDARYLSGTAGVAIADLHPGAGDWLRNTAVRLLPGTQYRFQQGGAIAPFVTTLEPGGTWTYPEASDGFLAGRGTATLALHGFPLFIDGTLAGGTGIGVQPLAGEFSYTQTRSVVLLPGCVWSLQAVGGAVTGTTFQLDTAGVVTFDPAAPLARDSFNGEMMLRVTGPLH